MRLRVTWHIWVETWNRKWTLENHQRVPSDVCSQRRSHVCSLWAMQGTCRLSKHTEPTASVFSTSVTAVALPHKEGQAQAGILIALSADQPTLWTIWELVWDAKRPQMVCVQQEKITPQNCLTPPSEVKNRQLYARRKKTKQVGQEPCVLWKHMTSQPLYFT